MRRTMARVLLLVASIAGPAHAQLPEPVGGVPPQPLAAQVRRVAEALDFVGQPLPAESKAELGRLLTTLDDPNTPKSIQRLLDSQCLAFVGINPESRVKVTRGPCPATLLQHGWRAFLVKVHNEAGVTSPLRVTSPNAAPMLKGSTGSAEPKASISPSQVVDRWLDLATFDDRPLGPTLSGLPVEYRIVQLYSRDAGPREAKLTFDVGQGTQDIGFRSDVDILFDAEAAIPLKLTILDEDSKPVTASLLIRDARGRVYPYPARRLAPDFFFHPQVYRQSGETVLLPPGTFDIEFTRGPEYKILTKEVSVSPGEPNPEAELKLERWAHLAERGWYSGDHHVHAAGCSHYESPTEGVTPDDMMRHILGEDLNVGCVLSWGPCWYFQKQFFSGGLHPLSTSDYLMRYDVEVSGFPSSHTGHLCLLRLKEDDYPGTTRIEEWPSWDLPVLKWGKSQGGVVGFSHSGWGLQTKSMDLPNDEIPAFDGIGANEYIVDVVHDAVDFISTVDTPAPWELNIWYHTLNCGYRCRISGETDFPCIYGERVGLGRSYVKLDQGPLDFDRWTEGIKLGRSYVGDGRSHLVDFRVNDLEVGTHGSELKLDSPGEVTVRADVAAYLPEDLSDTARVIRSRRLDQKPYWDIERARVGESRQVPVELIVNGQAVATQPIEADGQFRPIEFRTKIPHSSWVALRIYPSSHTNPIFLVVDGKPIRASRRSAEWCLKAVDQCWSQKQKATRPEEREAATAAYDVAREAYRRVLQESAAD